MTPEMVADINDIPYDDGWFKDHNRETYMRLAVVLADKLTWEEVMYVLRRAYAAAANEFGS